VQKASPIGACYGVERRPRPVDVEKMTNDHVNLSTPGAEAYACHTGCHNSGAATLNPACSHIVQMRLAPRALARWTRFGFMVYCIGHWRLPPRFLFFGSAFIMLTPIMTASLSPSSSVKLHRRPIPLTIPLGGSVLVFSK